MHHDKPMTELLTRYTNGSLNRTDLESKLFLYLAGNAQRYRLHTWDQDERMDYLCWLYPRLHRAIDVYQDTGASFDAYLQTLVYWSSREYRHRDALEQTMERILWRMRSDEAVHEEAPSYACQAPLPTDIRNQRQILILTLKSYNFVSEDFLARIAAALSMETEDLRTLVEAMRNLRLAKDRRIASMAERVSGQYYRCQFYLQKSRQVPPDSGLHHELLQRHARAKKRLVLMRQRLASFHRGATNLEVAEVLGVKKGTIDASLHFVKWRWAVNHE